MQLLEMRNVIYEINEHFIEGHKQQNEHLYTTMGILSKDK